MRYLEINAHLCMRLPLVPTAMRLGGCRWVPCSWTPKLGVRSRRSSVMFPTHIAPCTPWGAGGGILEEPVPSSWHQVSSLPLSHQAAGAHPCHIPMPNHLCNLCHIALLLRGLLSYLSLCLDEAKPAQLILAARVTLYMCRLLWSKGCFGCLAWATGWGGSCGW